MATTPSVTGRATLANSNGTPPSARKTTCPVSRDEFHRSAAPLTVKVGDVATLVMAPKDFSTGSIGFFENGKITVMIGGKPVTCQVNFSITLVGSKELPA